MRYASAVLPGLVIMTAAVHKTSDEKPHAVSLQLTGGYLLRISTVYDEDDDRAYQKITLTPPVEELE